MTQIRMLKNAINMEGMPMKKRRRIKQVFLLSRSVAFPKKPSIGEYDANRGFNVCISNGEIIPTSLCPGQMGTQSKTFAAPSDDDPDMDAEICY